MHRVHAALVVDHHQKEDAREPMTAVVRVERELGRVDETVSMVTTTSTNSRMNVSRAALSPANGSSSASESRTARAMCMAICVRRIYSPQPLHVAVTLPRELWAMSAMGATHERHV